MTAEGALPSAPSLVVGVGRRDLLSRLRGALSFADRTVLAADREHELWRVDLGQVNGFEKLLLEASVLALLAGRNGCVDEEVDALLRSVASRCDRAQLLRALRRQPALVTTAGTVLIILNRFGHTTQDEREALESVLGSPFVECFERTPFRLLDRRWVLQIAGRPARDDSAMVMLSTAVRRTHPIYLAREDVYAITHAVMYATDFGARRPPPALRARRLWESIDACLAWCLSVRDFDLTAELLLAQLLLRRRMSPYGQVAWRVARRTWDQLGFLPGPSLSAREFQALDDDVNRRQYAHYHMYHTIFVSGLLVNTLFALGLVERRARVPESTPESSAPSESRAVDDSAVAALISEWRDAAGDADLTPLAVDALIIQYAKANDVERLAEVLRCGAESERPTPTLKVGADFLAAQLAGSPSRVEGPEPQTVELVS